MKIESFLKDVGGASRVTSARREKFRKGSPLPEPEDPIRALSDALHPDKMRFIVTDVRDVSPTSKTWRLRSTDGHIPIFQSGQYVCFHLQIGDSVLNRPYSISSAPFESKCDNPFIEVTIRRNRPYFVPDYFFDHVKVGEVLWGSMPYGTFYYEPLRDSKNVVAIAGGSGITPFLSMAREIAAGWLDVNLTIIYGSVHSSDIVCGRELDEIDRKCDKVRVVHVMSDDPDWQGEKGFVNREIIEKYSGEDTTYMFCGPYAMYTFVEKIMKEMGVPAGRFRKDAIAQPDVSLIPGYPSDKKEEVYTIKVMRGIHEDIIQAAASEPVAVAVERAGIALDTHCRGGECGMCRSQLLEGEIFVSPIGDGRRRMDKELGWFHACSAYPMSDLVIKIPIL